MAYKKLTIDEAEALFEAAVEGVQFLIKGDGWKVMCARGDIGNRDRYLSPIEMNFEYPGIKYRVAVE